MILWDCRNQGSDSFFMRLLVLLGDGCLSRLNRGKVEEREEYGKSDWDWRVVLPCSGPSGAGPMVPRTPGSVSNAVELRGFAMAAGGGADRVQPVPGGDRLLRGFQAGVDGQLSRSGLGRDG